MAKDKTEKPATEKTEAKKSEEKAPKAKKEITIKLKSGAEFKGVVTSKRKINGGEQIFLKLNGLVSRWFNVKDIVK